MSRLESMFGAPALKYIKMELKRKGLADVLTKDGIRDDITVEDDVTGETISLNIAAASSDDGEVLTAFRIAAFQGVFDYLIAADIESHRTPGSGERRYGYIDTRKLKDAIVAGKISEPEQMNFISKETDIGDAKLFAQDLGYEFAAGGSEGLLRALVVLMQATIAE